MSSCIRQMLGFHGEQHWAASPPRFDFCVMEWRAQRCLPGVSSLMLMPASILPTLSILIFTFKRMEDVHFIFPHLREAELCCVTQLHFKNILMKRDLFLLKRSPYAAKLNLLTSTRDSELNIPRCQDVDVQSIIFKPWALGKVKSHCTC